MNGKMHGLYFFLFTYYWHLISRRFIGIEKTGFFLLVLFLVGFSAGNISIPVSHYSQGIVDKNGILLSEKSNHSAYKKHSCKNPKDT